jgi:hypothetical protein
MFSNQISVSFQQLVSRSNQASFDCLSYNSVKHWSVHIRQTCKLSKQFIYGIIWCIVILKWWKATRTQIYIILIDNIFAAKLQWIDVIVFSLQILQICHTKIENHNTLMSSRINQSGLESRSSYKYVYQERKKHSLF